MWSISQPKKGPLPCSCHLSAVGKLADSFSWSCTWLPHSARSQNQLLKTIVKSEFSYPSLLRFLMTLIFPGGWQLD